MGRPLPPAKGADLRGEAAERRALSAGVKGKINHQEHQGHQEKGTKRKKIL
jgi:hypothetical protein